MTNLFRNPTFTNLTDWKLTALDASAARVPGQTHDWGTPSVTPLSPAVDIHLSFTPFWCAFYQTVTGLTVGAMYKISWEVLATMTHPDVNPQPATDPVSWEARIKAGNAFGDWRDGSSLIYNTRVTLSATHVPASATDSIGIELRARHSLFRNHFTLSNPVLELASSPAPAPGGGCVPTDKLALLTTLVTALDVRIGLVEAVANGLKADRDAILTELLRIRNLPND